MVWERCCGWRLSQLEGRAWEFSGVGLCTYHVHTEIQLSP